MASRDRIVWCICVSCAAGSLLLAAWLSLLYADINRRVGPALPYVPDCHGEDLCSAWSHFRSAHPEPWQGITAKRLDDGDVALIVCEPTLPKDVLDPLAATLFGSDLRSSVHRQWLLGADGWLDD